jgi:membrane-associated protease RseP (regulator of RpoE activity)
MQLCAQRVLGGLLLLVGAAACAHPPYPYPPPPQGPYDAPPGWYEPAAFPRRIGVQVQPLTPELREYFGVEGNAGLLVAAVEARSPAATAGMRAGDVILRAEGYEMYEPEHLVEVLQRVPEGEAVDLLVLRNGRAERIAVMPTPREEVAGPGQSPPPAGASDPELRERVRELEARVEELERELGRRRRD